MKHRVATLIVLVAASFGVPPLAHATSFLVTRTDDPTPAACDRDCSLREAVIAANATPGADTITLPNIGGPFRLTIPHTGADDATTGDLNITGDTTIIGSGAVGKKTGKNVATEDA